MVSTRKQTAQETPREKDPNPVRKNTQKRLPLVFLIVSLILTYSAALAYTIRKDQGIILGLKACALGLAFVGRAGSVFLPQVPRPGKLILTLGSVAISLPNSIELTVSNIALVAIALLSILASRRSLKALAVCSLVCAAQVGFAIYTLSTNAQDSLSIALLCFSLSGEVLQALTIILFL